MSVFLTFICICFIDPYGRSPPFTPLGALGSGAFGGLGSPTLGQSKGGQFNPPIILNFISKKWNIEEKFLLKSFS